MILNNRSISRPSISIVTPIYNGEKWLERCVDSIISAAEGYSIELILIDDGSVDNSVNIAQNYSNSFPWIKLICQKNSGPSAARNVGINLALGGYIGFVDCDDTIDKDYFSVFLESIEHEPDIIVFGFKRISLGNEDRTYCPLPKNHNKQSDYLLSHVSNDRELFWYPHTKWFKSELIKNIRFNENMRLGEDTVFNLQAVSSAQFIIRIPVVLYFYHETLGSLSSSNYKPNLLENMEQHFSQRLEVHRATKSGLSEKAWSDIYNYYIFHILPWLMTNSNHLDRKNQLNELIRIRNSDFVNVCYAHGKKLGNRPKQILIQALFRANSLKALQRYLSIALAKNEIHDRRNFKNVKKITKKIPLPLKVWVLSTVKRKNFPLNKGKNTCFIFLAADYGNIGDVAITKAQKLFLEKTLPNYEVVSIPISQTRLVLRSIKRQIKSDDIVTIIGGGNMGAIYPDIEELRQLVIRSFPHNRIVCFPQTLDWEESTESKRALKRIVKTYSHHSDIHIFARESISHKKLNELFDKHSNVNIGLVPDIVMSATAESLGARDCVTPAGILRCLRDDKEAALSDHQYSILDKALAQTGYKIDKTDTHAGGSQLSEEHCAKLLSDKLSQFRSAKLVVTDRLHGMILSLLSGTPCLVLPNANHKIRQTYLDWLKSNPRVIFVEPDQFDEIPVFIKQLLLQPRGAINISPVDSTQYDSLRQALIKS